MSGRNGAAPPHRPRRRGSAYLLVLVTTAIVTTIALTAATTWHSRLLASALQQDQARARLHGMSALDLGLLHTRNSSTWRSGGEAWMEDRALGDGLISLYAWDPGDGNLGDDEMDPVRLRAIGRSGIAREVIEATLEAVPQPLSSLESGLHTQLDLVLANATVTSERPLRTNGSAVITSSSVDAGVEATGLVSTVGYTGSKSSGAPARTLPETSVVAAYAAGATPISIASFPSTGGIYMIENALFSPAHNPSGGAANVDGRYVIDLLGQPLRIANSRVQGTLILRNAPLTTVIEQSVNFEPIVPAEPVLLVEGSIHFTFTDAPLSETATGTSLNPAGAPYGGASDSDLADEYPSHIAGLVYISGDALLEGSPTFGGPVLIGAGATIRDRLTLRNDGAWLATPPDGFSGRPLMRIAAGSLSRAGD